MAESPPHRFGQIIGGLLEEIIEFHLAAFVRGNTYFLDKRGERRPVRSGLKLSWSDDFGNSHDLDFVIEKGGSAATQGRPVAFIEAAWRRYTKHSRNKVQEIQGAILPIAAKHSWDKPFLGAVLAGEFTPPSLEQLRSLEFEVLYLPYETIMSSFDYVEIDARFDEKTPDAEFKRCVDAIEALDSVKRESLKERLLELNRDAFSRFFTALAEKLARVVDRIVILPLFGEMREFSSMADAAVFVQEFDGTVASPYAFQKFEIRITFSNGDAVDGLFGEKNRALKFLEFVAS